VGRVWALRQSYRQTVAIDHRMNLLVKPPRDLSTLAFNQPAGHREGICLVLLDQSPLCQRFAESHVGTFHFGLNEAFASKAGRSSSALPSEGARDDVRRVGSRNERLSNPLVMDIQWRGIAMAKPSEKEIAARAYRPEVLGPVGRRLRFDRRAGCSMQYLD